VDTPEHSANEFADIEAGPVSMERAQPASCPWCRSAKDLSAHVVCGAVTSVASATLTRSGSDK